MATKASVRGAWKRIERKVAAYIGGKRVPVTGRQRGDAPDIAHAWLSVECKYRAAIPTYLREGMTQAEASAMPRQLPVVILVEKGQEVGESLICVRLRDFRDHWL